MGRWRCAGDDTDEEGPLDAQLTQRQVWDICEGQICSVFPHVSYLFLLEECVSWKACCIWAAAVFGWAVLWVKSVMAAYAGAARELKSHHPGVFNNVFLSVFAAEACLPFFTAYGGVLSGSKLWLNHELDAYNATTGEREAYEKIQQCFREGGLKAKFLEPKILVTVLSICG